MTRGASGTDPRGTREPDRGLAHREAWYTGGGQERVSNAVSLSLDRNVATGGRSAAILAHLERAQPGTLALARRVAGLWHGGRRAVTSDSFAGQANPLACGWWLRGSHQGVPNVVVAPRIFDEMDTLAPELWSEVVTESRVSAGFGYYARVEEQIDAGTRFAMRAHGGAKGS